ncbi:amidohydrolase [Paenibacillus sp. IITD108]|uniref:amidohydrolase n=1 Tax=Paenibacillus sp. IITD108 TaxID=3116649 RepID=UPI002F3EA9AC
MNQAAILKSEAFSEQLTRIRRHLHQHPELSNEETETTAYIASLLKSEGIRVVDYGLKTGVVAEIGGQLGGPIVVLRADIDALAIQEETELPYASVYPGKMHACGHDYHTASLIGAAYMLKQQEKQLNGTVRLIFQPAEEKASGARQVVRSGALHEVEAIFGLHNKPDLPVGTIGIAGGPLMAAADGFTVSITGAGSHAAVPESGVDPIVAASHIVTALQSIVSRNVSALQSAVISVTKIHSGTSWNIIPETALLDGTIRTFDEKVREDVLARFVQVTEGVAAALGAKAEICWTEGPPPVVNDWSLVKLADEAAAAIGLEIVRPVPSPAGEDFAVYQKEVPGLFVFFGTSGSKEWHHPAFDVDERALPFSAAYLSQIAVGYLNSRHNAGNA